MTRSRKKTPCCHYVNKDGWYKGHYNRRLRRNPIDWDEGVPSLPDGNAYRRANESWEIDDYRATHVTLDEFRCDEPCRKLREGKTTCRRCYERLFIGK